MTSSKPYDGPTVTHCAHVLTSEMYRGRRVYRTFSKYTNGTIAHTDTIYRSVEIHGQIYMMEEFIHIGQDPDMEPPVDVVWIDTRRTKAST